MTSKGAPEMLGRDELQSLLTKTSRTFALAIPILGEPLATDVGLAYLLFRIADTLEDATLWRRDVRVAALGSFVEWLQAPIANGAGAATGARAGAATGAGAGAASDVGAAASWRWMDEVAKAPPVADAGCLELLARADAVKAALLAQGADAARAVIADVCRTSERMAGFVSRQTDDGAMALRDLSDLQEYCYAVAGIVGEMLTALFTTREPSLASRRAALAEHAPAFGEGLQLVNILKDASSDAREGRVYIPRNVPRADVMEVARRDLDRAAEYVRLLREGGASRGTVDFCEVPRRLAVKTLEALEEGAPKLTREEVMRVFLEVTAA